MPKQRKRKTNFSNFKWPAKDNKVKIMYLKDFNKRKWASKFHIKNYRRTIAQRAMDTSLWANNKLKVMAKGQWVSSMQFMIKT